MSFNSLYKQSVEKLLMIKKYLMNNLHKKFIVSSQALFVSSILFVRKHDEELRFCINYQKLNVISKKDQYSLLLIDETLQCLSNAKIFTKIDICQTFHHIQIHLDSENLTIF